MIGAVCPPARLLDASISDSKPRVPLRSCCERVHADQRGALEFRGGGATTSRSCLSNEERKFEGEGSEVRQEEKKTTRRKQAHACGLVHGSNRYTQHSLYNGGDGGNTMSYHGSTAQDIAGNGEGRIIRGRQSLHDIVLCTQINA